MASVAVPLQYSKLSSDQHTYRNRLKSMMDGFCTFGFNGISPEEMYDKYGAFIINDRNSLKFYNTPSFSNEYTSPQFSRYTQLNGVTFKTQQIKFQIGLYYFTIDEYRNFLYQVLNPLVIGNLVFSFSPSWCYQVKVANYSDSTRYILGHVTGDGEDKYAYYTELTVTWDIQGEACARSTDIVLWNSITTPEEESAALKSQWQCQIIQPCSKPTLDMPFVFNFDIAPIQQPVIVTIQALLTNPSTGNKTTTLATFKLNNWTDAPETNIHLTYNSESGIIYYTFGNEQSKILSSLNSTQSGQKLVEYIWINKFWIPGLLSIPNINYDNLYITAKLTDITGQAFQGFTKAPVIEAYWRTNII